MNQKTLFILWGGLFIVCASLGFIPEPEGFVGICSTALSLGFFLPPAVLLYQGSQKNDVSLLKLIRNLSLLSLSLTLLLLVLNFLTVLQSPWLGAMLHAILVIVSSPMVSSGCWAVSLFLWAMLLMGSFSALKKAKTT